MDRRRFLLTSLAGALGMPRAAEAQQAPKVARVAYVITTSPLSTGPLHPPTRDLLKALGALGLPRERG